MKLGKVYGVIFQTESSVNLTSTTANKACPCMHCFTFDSDTENEKKLNVEFWRSAGPRFIFSRSKWSMDVPLFDCNLPVRIFRNTSER